MTFKLGTNYQAKFKRTTLKYIHLNDDFYELHKQINNKLDFPCPVVLFKDLENSIRNHFGFPKDLSNIQIEII